MRLASGPIVLIGSASDEALEHYYRRSLSRAMGSAVILIPARDAGLPQSRFVRAFSRLSELMNRRRRNREILKKLVAMMPSIIIIFKGDWLLPDEIREIGRTIPSALLVNINPDDPYSTEFAGSSNTSIRESVPLFHLYVTFAESIANALEAHGAKSPLVLPFAYDQETMWTESEVTRAGEHFLFYGAWDPKRQALLSAISGFPLRVYGPGWQKYTAELGPHVRFCGDWLVNPNLGLEVFEALGVINPLRTQNLQSHNMRTFEVPAMGGLLITNRTPQHIELFGEEDGAVFYEAIEELPDILLKIQQKPTEWQERRNRGRLLVHGHHYDERAARLAQRLADIRVLKEQGLRG